MPAADRPSLAERWLHEGVSPGPGSIRQLWQWLADPARADAERICFVGGSRPASRGKGPQALPGAGHVAEWLPLIARLLDRQRRAVSRGRHAAVSRQAPAPAAEPGPEGTGHGGGQPAPTLVLAVLRGLLADLLATGDRERVQRAFDVFEPLLEVIEDAA